jgi:hypothetical protein
MNTTGVRPLEFACSTCWASRWEIEAIRGSFLGATGGLTGGCES